MSISTLFPISCFPSVYQQVREQVSTLACSLSCLFQSFIHYLGYKLYHPLACSLSHIMPGLFSTQGTSYCPNKLVPHPHLVAAIRVGWGTSLPLTSLFLICHRSSLFMEDREQVSVLFLGTDCPHVVGAKSWESNINSTKTCWKNNIRFKPNR